MYKKITKLDYLLFKRMQKIRVKNLNDTCMQLVNYIGEKSVLSDFIALGDKFELDFVKSGQKSNELGRKLKQSGNDHYSKGERLFLNLEHRSKVL